jgi:hypothetical protein
MLKSVCLSCAIVPGTVCFIHATPQRINYHTEKSRGRERKLSRYNILWSNFHITFRSTFRILGGLTKCLRYIRYLVNCFNLFCLQKAGKLLVKAKRVGNGDGFNVYVNLLHTSTSDVFYAD